MIDKNQSASNKKSAGKGNGNSVINNKNTQDTVSDYVSGDYPSSTSHKFSKNTNTKDEK